MIENIFIILMTCLLFGGFFFFQKVYENDMKEAREEFYKVTGRYPPANPLKFSKKRRRL